MKMREVEEIIISCETGEELHRGVRPLTLSYGGESITVDMPGWYSVDGEISEHSQEDMKVSDHALNIMKARVEGLPLPAEIRSIRKKFQLTQEQAGTILGGGARAFQKYESGEILPSRTMANLLLILQEYPQGIETLRARRKKLDKIG
jgi:putative zinc finger/helix-turn-helix protein, ygiT family